MTHQPHSFRKPQRHQTDSSSAHNGCNFSHTRSTLDCNVFASTLAFPTSPKKSRAHARSTGQFVRQRARAFICPHMRVRASSTTNPQQTIIIISALVRSPWPRLGISDATSTNHRLIVIVFVRRLGMTNACARSTCINFCDGRIIEIPPNRLRVSGVHHHKNAV